MKVLFIGLGSIARRHIRNLRALCQNNVHITVLRSGNGAEPDRETAGRIDRTVYHSCELSGRYDAVFITNPTALHYDTLLACQDKSDCFFIEKPVFATGEEDISPFLLPKKAYYVACPLRYTNVIRYLKEQIDFSKIYAMRCISSSYLPDWRPGTDYRNTYSAHRSMGGGVSVDLVHEWDYIYYLAGAPREVKSLIEKKSRLEIDADDIAVYIADYPDKVVELHLDYFGRETVRKIELFGEEDTIYADLHHQKIEWARRGKVIDLSQQRDEFQKRELEHFLQIAAGTCACDHGIGEACEVLRITRGKNVCL